MANTVIAWPNIVDDATLSGGQWSATLPLLNLKDRIIGNVARTVGRSFSDTVLTAALPATTPLRVVSLIGHNLSLTAGIRVTVYSDAAATTQVHASGFVWAWPPSYRSGATPARYYSWRRWATTYVLPAGISGRAVTIAIEDASNPAGFVEVGRLFLGPGWQPVRNMSYGASRSWLPRSRVAESVGGVEHVDRRVSRRVQQISLDHLAGTDALTAFDLMGAADVSDEVMYIFNPGDEEDMVRGSFLGRLSELSPLEYPGPLRNRAAYKIQEII